MITKTVITTVIIDDQADDRVLEDWSTIVKDLCLKNTLVQLARRTGSYEGILSNLKNNVTTEPKYSLGIQLMALHGLECSDKHQEMGL